MEHPFFPTTTTRAEALRWLTIAEKLLSARDLMGSKSFATRARDSDPTLTPADQILVVVDTLLAGDRWIGNNQQDLYGILRLTPLQGREPEAIAAQYRNLAIALNPQRNKFPFAEQAFRLVVDAWSVLSDPTRKLLYDREISFYSPPPPPPPQPQPQSQQPHQAGPYGNPLPAMHQNFMFFGNSSSSGLTPQPQSSGVPFPQVQVHASARVDPVGVGSTREPQNFMSFTSGTNLAFGGASASKVSSDPVNKQTPISNFPSNVANAHPEQNYSSVGEKTNHDMNVSENVGEGEEEEEEEEVEERGEEEERLGAAGNDSGSTFWTACPYCYYMYEYPNVYADCTLRCQNCKKAFEAVVILSPPLVVDGQDGYFCCWGFLPLGFSMENWERNKNAASSWTPFSPMFTCPQTPAGKTNTRKAPHKSSAPRIYVDDDEVFVDLSESSGSDDDWNKDAEKKNKRAKSVKGKGTSGTSSRSVRKTQADNDNNVTVQEGVVPQNGTEKPNKPAGDSIQKVSVANARKQPGRVAKNFEKLDLNVEFSNESEEPASRVNQGNGPSRGEDDNIEGIGFFEGLDEFLSSLPILNVVGEEKVVKAA